MRFPTPHRKDREQHRLLPSFLGPKTSKSPSMKQPLNRISVMPHTDTHEIQICSFTRHISVHVSKTCRVTCTSNYAAPLSVLNVPRNGHIWIWSIFRTPVCDM